MPEMTMTMMMMNVYNMQPICETVLNWVWY